MARLSMEQPIVLNAFNPFVGAGSSGKLNERMHVYYCYDEITAAQWTKRHGGRLENLYLEQVDAVITTSDAKTRGSIPVRTVKNGVDAELFATARSGDQERGKTVLGYVGSVDDRFDVDLIRNVARTFPDAEIRIIGRIVRNEIADRLAEYGNVVCTGPMQMSDLPGEMASFTVGLIPFVQSEFTKHVYPLKVNEYLAAGVPVVMTDFANLPEFTGQVHVAASEDKFISAIRKATHEWHAEEIQERQEMGKRNDWNVRVDDFSDFLSTVESEKIGRAA
jgi:glycosyltransferase involved in cell wall biosynthesis